MKFYELMEHWLNNYVKGIKAKKTHQCYRECMNMIIKNSPCICNRRIDELQEMEFQSFLFSLSDVYSKSTLNHIRTVIYKSYDVALRNNIIPIKTITKLEIPKNASEKNVVALTKNEQKIIEKIVVSENLGHIVIFLLKTGVRIGELLELKWSDFDRKNNSIKINKSKTENGIREIPLSVTARLILERCRAYQKEKGNEYIFLNTKGNKLTYSSVKKLFSKIRNISGIRNFTPHICRYSFATRMVENGCDIKALATMLGHKNSNFTIQRYVTADIDFLKNQIKLIDM